MRAYERLLNYVKVWTTSDEESTTSPTTARQFDLAKLLVEEMVDVMASGDDSRTDKDRRCYDGRIWICVWSYSGNSGI